MYPQCLQELKQKMDEAATEHPAVEGDGRGDPRDGQGPGRSGIAAPSDDGRAATTAAVPSGGATWSSWRNYRGAI